MSSMLNYHIPHLSLQPEGMERGGGMRISWRAGWKGGA